MRGRVLVVDDDEDIRDVLGMVLEAHGYEVHAAADGAEALEQLRRGPQPDLLLLDLMMPRLNGMELMRAMKQEEMLEQMPVLILSGNRAVRHTAAELGAQGALVKPVELDELLLAVDRLVQSAQHLPGAAGGP